MEGKTLGIPLVLVAFYLALILPILVGQFFNLQALKSNTARLSQVERLLGNHFESLEAENVVEVEATDSAEVLEELEEVEASPTTRPTLKATATPEPTPAE
jgi:hypothetical protein